MNTYYIPGTVGGPGQAGDYQGRQGPAFMKFIIIFFLLGREKQINTVFSGDDAFSEGNKIGWLVYTGWSTSDVGVREGLVEK